MPRSDSAVATNDDDRLLEFQSSVPRPSANSAISGIMIAVGTSLLLWAGLAQVARIAARAIL